MIVLSGHEDGIIAPGSLVKSNYWLGDKWLMQRELWSEQEAATDLELG